MKLFLTYSIINDKIHKLWKDGKMKLDFGNLKIQPIENNFVKVDDPILKDMTHEGMKSIAQGKGKM